MWDTSWLLSEGSMFGRLLHTLIGYTERPTGMQLIVYVAHAAGDVPADAVRARARRKAARSNGLAADRQQARQRRPPPSAAKAVSGARSISLSSARAGPRGERLPCSQLRTVSSGTSIFSAKAACVRPQRDAHLAHEDGRIGVVHRLLAAVGEDFDDPPVRFQPHPHHGPPPSPPAMGPRPRRFGETQG